VALDPSSATPSAAQDPWPVRHGIGQGPRRGPHCIHEIKHDGYRLMVRGTAGGRDRIRTRLGCDCTRVILESLRVSHWCGTEVTGARLNVWGLNWQS
jgi:hypothetical protein